MKCHNLLTVRESGTGINGDEKTNGPFSSPIFIHFLYHIPSPVANKKSPQFQEFLDKTQ